MLKGILIAVMVTSFSVLMFSCQSSPSNSNTTANATPAEPTTAAAPDNSEITTATDSSGTKTETRMFRDNPRVSRVVVTTRNGERTTKVYSSSGEERNLKTDTVDALHATGNAIGDAAGFVATKSETAFDKTKEGTKTVAEKTSDTAKTVGEKTKDVSRTVAEKSTNTGKIVVHKSKAAVKKTGRTIKKIVTP